VSKKERTVVVSFHLPKSLLEEIDKLVEKGLFQNRSEVVRAAIRELLSEYGP